MSVHVASCRRKRLRQRGAIFVEALLVSMFLIGCLQLIWRSVSRATVQQQSRLGVRAETWHEAVTGCGELDMAALAGVVTDASATDVCGDESCENGNLAGLGAAGPTVPGWFELESAQDSMSYSMLNAKGGQDTGEASAKTTCNPVRGGGGALAVPGVDREELLDQASAFLTEAGFAAGGEVTMPPPAENCQTFGPPATVSPACAAAGGVGAPTGATPTDATPTGATPTEDKKGKKKKAKKKK